MHLCWRFKFAHPNLESKSIYGIWILKLLIKLAIMIGPQSQRLFWFMQTHGTFKVRIIPWWFNRWELQLTLSTQIMPLNHLLDPLLFQRNQRLDRPHLSLANWKESQGISQPTPPFPTSPQKSPSEQIWGLLQPPFSRAEAVVFAHISGEGTSGYSFNYEFHDSQTIASKLESTFMCFDPSFECRCWTKPRLTVFPTFS